MPINEPIELKSKNKDMQPVNSITKITSKLSLIMGEIGIIEKDKTNEFHKYKYASEFAIKKALQPLLVKYKVLFTVGVTKVANELITDVKGGQNMVTNIEIGWTFTDTESGEQFSGVFAGSGADKGDKGLYKAITGAIKYVLTSTFLIPTGDDPENEKVSSKGQYKIKTVNVNTDLPPDFLDVD